MKLMVLDGNSIVNRAFYGVRMLNTSQGTPTNAVFGFLNIFRRLMAEESPDAVCVTFDLKAPTFRHEKYDGYKAQRKGMPDELAVQMPILKETLDAMNVKRFDLEGWEADDLIGTMSEKCCECGWDCVVVTGDKDSFQLINRHTTIRHVKSRMGQTETKMYDEESFQEEYGFEPKKLIDLKALMGDSSDNIPGVAGVGEKTAMELVRRFGTIEDIYKNIDTIDIKDSVRKKLIAGKEQAEMSYDLATIRCCAPIDFSPDEALVRPVDNDKLYEQFKKLEFRKLIDAFGLTPPSEKSEPGEAFQAECVSIKVETLEEAEAMFSDICAAEAVNVRIDTGFYTVIAEHNCTAYIISQGETENFSHVLARLFSNHVKKVGHNVKDIMHALLKAGYPAEGWVFDTALAAYLIDPTANSYELGRLTELYGNFSIGAAADENGQMTLDADITKLAALMSEAAAIGFLKDVLEKKLSQLDMERLYYDVELPLCRVLADMELAGFLVDRNALDAFGNMLGKHIDMLQKSIWELAGEEFNINSPKQLGDVLFNKLMLPAPKKTKTGYSTNVDVLNKLKNRHPIIEMILEYRELTKLKSTYTDGLQKVIADDGRIHTNFQMTVTATGRLSSTEPNLQNIPVRKELGGEIRKMFVAEKGNVLVDADYSQIELRLLAHISQDENMRNAFLSGEDIHAMTASQVFSVPLEQVTHFMRSSAKAVNFGIVYGISAFSLSEDLGISVAEARDYINKYLTTYSGVNDYMERVVREAKETGYVSTLFGRRRPLPELNSSNFNLRSFGERVARNMPIQGTAADIMKIAMINVHRALKESGLKARMLLQVHDELIVECPESEAEQVKNILKSEMEGAASLSVPLTVEAKSGESWYDAK